MILRAALLVLLWGMTAVRLPTVWRDGRQRSLWATIFVLALGFTGVQPHLCGVVAAFFLLRFLGMVTGAVRPHTPLALTAGVLVVLATLAAISGGSPESPGPDRPASAAAYWGVFGVYLVAVLVATVVLFARVARDAPAGLPRLGMWSIAAGATLVGISLASQTVLIVGRGTGAPAALEPVQSVGVLLAVGGSVVPAGRRARSVWSAYRSLLVLRPLWKAMREAFPEIILFTPRRAVIELAGVDDVHLRLYRRVIEIRDGMLALRGYLPADRPAAADPAEREAAAIVLALRRRQRGEPATERAGGWQPVGPEMADEVAWLSRVSHALRRPRVTAADAAPTPTPSGSAR